MKIARRAGVRELEHDRRRDQRRRAGTASPRRSAASARRTAAPGGRVGRHEAGSVPHRGGAGVTGPGRDDRPAAGRGALRRRWSCSCWIDLKLFARGREPSFAKASLWSIGWLVVGLAAALVVWASEGEDDAVAVHDGLPDRALAVARQPVRLPAAVLVLRDPGGAATAAAVLGHRGRDRAARPRDPGRRRADRAVPLRDLHARRDAAGAGLPHLPRRRARTSIPTRTSSSGWCARSSR